MCGFVECYCRDWKEMYAGRNDGLSLPVTFIIIDDSWSFQDWHKKDIKKDINKYTDNRLLISKCLNSKTISMLGCGARNT